MPARRISAARRWTRLRSLAAACIAALIAGGATSARAATFTWSNSPSNSQWAVGQNWSPNGVPGSGDVVQFTLISTSPAINLNGPRTVSGVLFGGLSPYSLTGGSLTVTGGSVATSGLVLATSYNINVPVTLGAATTFSIGDNSTLSVSQAVTDSSNFQLRKTGSGVLALTGGSSSVFTLSVEQGTLDVNGGALTVRSADVGFPISISSATRVRGGGKLSGQAGVNMRIGGGASPTLTVEGVGSEVKDLAQLVVGEGVPGNLSVSSGAKLSGIGTLVVGKNPGSATSTAVISAGGMVESTVAALGAFENVEGAANVSGLGSAWQTVEMRLGTLGAFDGDGRGVLIASNGGAVTASGDTRFFGGGSSIIVDQGVYSTARLITEPGSSGIIQVFDNPALGAALVITNPDVNNTPNFGGAIVDRFNGVGGVKKTGAGTQIFSGHNTYTGGTIIEEGVLKLAVSGALAPTGDVEIAGGTLDLGGQAQRIGDFKLTNGTLAGAAGSTLLTANVDVMAGTIATPLITSAPVTKQGAGTVTVTAPLTANALVIVGGVIDAQAGVTATLNVAAGGEYRFRGSHTGAVSGNVGSAATLTGSAVVAGDVVFGGTLNVGSHALSIASGSVAQVAATQLAGGTVVAPNGYQISGTISGRGTVLAKVRSVPASPPASIVAVGGPLTMGLLAESDSLSEYLGSLTAGVQQLVLLSSGYTSLGTAATVNGGSINSINGVQVNVGKSLSGFGVINGPLKNLGTVTGGSGVNVLRFTGPVTGGGSFAGNVQFEASYSPGASAAEVQFDGDPVFAPSSMLEVEIGGVEPGDDFDRLAVDGMLTLGGKLRVSLIDGFTPTLGDSFDILDWATLDGKFTSLELPELAGLRWDVSQLYTAGALVVAPLDADFDLNSRVDGADFTIWKAGFGDTAASHSQGDATGEGAVGGEDFLVWQRQFGVGVEAQPASAAVPEPAASMFAESVVVVLFAGRKRRAFAS